MPVKPIPDGYHTATPCLIVKGAAEAVEFYKKAFGAVETMRCDMPGGKVGHVEFQIGDSRIMMADEFPEWGCLGPQSVGGSPVSICLYVEDVDVRFAQAIAAGATAVMPVKDQFYGDRSGKLTDPFGHVWTIATHIEDVSIEEIHRRMETWMKQQCSAA
jgi:PhnB protein